MLLSLFEEREVWAPSFWSHSVLVVGGRQSQKSLYLTDFGYPTQGSGPGVFYYQVYASRQVSSILKCWKGGS
jgi:hypothetical protein